MFIDGNIVVDNDGLHGMKEVKGVIALAAGLHPIRVDFLSRASTIPQFRGLQGQMIPQFWGQMIPQFQGQIIPQFQGQIIPQFQGQIIPQSRDQMFGL